MAKAPPRQAFRKLVLRTLPEVTQAPFPGFIGVPDFLALRSAMSRGQGRLLFFAFDLLYLDGFGKAGTGFTVKSAQSVRNRLAPLHRKTPPLAKPLNRPDTIWVEPEVIADIAFTELTEDGMLRHASFKGLKS